MVRVDEEAKPVRRLSEIDLPGIAEGLGSNDDAWRWWYDPSTGETHMAPGYAHSDVLDEEEWDPIGLGMMEIERGGSRRAYEDTEEFAEAVGQRRAGDLLVRALEGRGAFRRFRDTLDDFDDLVPQWRAFSDAAEQMRAIRWLSEERLVSDDDAAEQLAARAAIQSAVLAAIGTSAALEVELSSLAERLDEVERQVDLGHEVQLLRNGRRWATIVRD